MTTEKTVMNESNKPICLSASESDIETANSAWTEADVDASAAGIAARYSAPSSRSGGGGGVNLSYNERIVKPTLVMNPDATSVTVELDRGVRKFWNSNGSRFSAIWRGMKPQARRNLLLTIGPEMAQTKNDPEAYGQLMLLPEFVVSELSNQDEALIQVIKQAAVADDLATQYRKDSEMIRRLIREGVLTRDETKRGEIAFLVGRSLVGETLSVNRSRASREDLKKLNQMIESGMAIEGPVFGHVLQRRQLLLQTVALILDEMSQNVLFAKKKDANNPISASLLQCAHPACSNTQWKGDACFSGVVDGEEDRLRMCSRCGITAYCSRTCQTGHWKEHKKSCNKKRKEKTTTQDNH